MSDSAREEYGSGFEASSYAMFQSVIPRTFEPQQSAYRAADRVVQVSPSNAVTRRSARWPGITVEIVQASRRGRIDHRYCGSMHMLVVHDRGVRHDGCTVIEGISKSTLHDCRRKLVFVPAGHRFHDWHEPRTLSRVVFFYFDPAQLGIEPEIGSACRSLAPRLFFEDGTLVETALKLATFIESDGPDHRHYAEALGVILAHELARIRAGGPPAEAAISGGLAGWQRRKVVAYIEEHLAESISLAALASLIGLSTSHFCRAFGQSCGIPPQRYHLRQRIERAKTLLAKHAASVTEVGFAVGYKHTSAFCTAFRRVTGLTPNAYRRNLS